jgi:hypothetical protein
LNRRLPGVDVTLVEASDIPIIGVGESTNPVIRYFHQIVGVEEGPFMRAANAAYKLAIRFEHFNRPGGAFYHPFGQPAGTGDGLFKPNAQALHTSFHLAQTATLFSKSCSYAYQLDAGLYGQYLKEQSRRRGVRHVIDRITGAELAADGNIAGVRTERSGLLSADLFVDCSGFRSLLLGQTLHEPFHSVSRYLLNDRAIAVRVPYVDKQRELKVYTNCTALSAGWVWQIPLWSRLGTGYVYSSAYATPEAAEAEFRDFLGAERVKDLAFSHIEIRAGRHERAWVRNCVGIGISYGFLEPLESTGLSLTQVAIIDLARALDAGATSVSRRSFNRRQAEMFDTTRDFVASHYVLTARDDTPYWRHVRYDCDVPDSLIGILDRAAAGSYAPIEGQINTFYDRLNWNLILSGMGMFDRMPPERFEAPVPAASPLATVLAQTVYADEVEEKAAEPEPVSAAQPQWSPTW